MAQVKAKFKAGDVIKFKNGSVWYTHIITGFSDNGLCYYAKGSFSTDNYSNEYLMGITRTDGMYTLSKRTETEKDIQQWLK
jgi:hypothetical protein